MIELNEIEQKKKFAYEFLRDPNNSFGVAKNIFNDPYDPKIVGKALRISREWPKDPVVIAEKERLLKNNGERHFLPTKEQLSRELLTKAREAKDFDSSHKFYKLYAETQGLIEKPTTNITANIQNHSNRVMVITNNGSDEDWEVKAKAQQEKLINDA